MKYIWGDTEMFCETSAATGLCVPVSVHVSVEEETVMKIAILFRVFIPGELSLFFV